MENTIVFKYIACDSCGERIAVPVEDAHKPHHCLACALMPEGRCPIDGCLIENGKCSECGGTVEKIMVTYLMALL